MPDYNRLPTIQIIHPETGEMRIINESDYQPGIHVLWTGRMHSPDVESAPESTPKSKSKKGKPDQVVQSDQVVTLVDRELDE